MGARQWWGTNQPGVLTATEALGLRSLAQDLGMRVNIVMYMDASAAIGVLQRQGLGRMKHIEVQSLWLQDSARKKEVEIRKVHTDENLADLMTKPLAKHKVDRHLDHMFVSVSG